MPRLISIMDDRKRDAQIGVEGPRKEAGRSYLNAAGDPVTTARFIKQPEGHDFDALLDAHDGDLEALAEALVAGDPEIDLELTGRELGESDRVWVRADGSVLYSARVLKVVYDAAGEEQSRADWTDVEATVSDESPLAWSGRMFDKDQVVRRFVLQRKLQLRHVNGLTFDFLYEIAKKLADEGKMLFVGTGARGTNPLIFQSNGSPYRGFLEGRVEGDGFRLVLHLSNLELKRVD